MIYEHKQENQGNNLPKGDKTQWEQQATNILKAELARRGLNYENLQQALKGVGIEKETSNLTKTINLGKFSFAFFLQCAEAIQLDKLQIK